MTSNSSKILFPYVSWFTGCRNERAGVNLSYSFEYFWQRHWSAAIHKTTYDISWYDWVDFCTEIVTALGIGMYKITPGLISFTVIVLKHAACTPHSIYFYISYCIYLCLKLFMIWYIIFLKIVTTTNNAFRYNWRRSLCSSMLRRYAWRPNRISNSVIENEKGKSENAVGSPFVSALGPCITITMWRCRNPFNQWRHSFQWKLGSHWLTVLRQRHIVAVISSPVC